MDPSTNSDAPPDDRLPPHLVRVAILVGFPAPAAPLLGAGPPAEPQDNDTTASASEPRRSS